jgi:hypothetical protein
MDTTSQQIEVVEQVPHSVLIEMADTLIELKKRNDTASLKDYAFRSFGECYHLYAFSKEALHTRGKMM